MSRQFLLAGQDNFCLRAKTISACGSDVSPHRSPVRVHTTRSVSRKTTRSVREKNKTVRFAKKRRIILYHGRCHHLINIIPLATAIKEQEAPLIVGI